MVRVPDHPRAKRSPYVFEHILVAERILGRYLEPGESVHHRNGVRDDNGPENLELWTKPQPSGIRVSDAITWAIEILDRYVGEGSWRTSNNALADESTLGGGGSRTFRVSLALLHVSARLACSGLISRCPRVTVTDRCRPSSCVTRVSRSTRNRSVLASPIRRSGRPTSRREAALRGCISRQLGPGLQLLARSDVTAVPFWPCCRTTLRQTTESPEGQGISDLHHRFEGTPSKTHDGSIDRYLVQHEDVPRSVELR